MADKKLNPIVKGIIWVGVIATVGVTGYVAVKMYTRWKDKKNQGGQPVVDDKGVVATVFGNTPSTCKHCVKDAEFPLRKGSQGKQVAALQYAYNLKFPNDTLLVDGDWGGKTERAFYKLGLNTLSFNGGYNNFLNAGVNTTTTTGTTSGGGKGTGDMPSVKVEKPVYDKYFKSYEKY